MKNTLFKVLSVVTTLTMVFSGFAFASVAKAAVVVEPGTNPSLSDSCGIDMVLVLDTSLSIDGGELGQMKSAFDSFAGAFLPSTPASVAVVSFDTNATSESGGFTSDLSTAQSAIDGVTTHGSGYTNWEAGLTLARSQFSVDGNSHLVVFASDGNPTASSAGANDTNQPNVHLDPAITEANLIKGDGTRIVTLGIGDDLNAQNLKDISSDDAYFASDFSNLGSDLATLASSLCGGTIKVTKLLDTPGEGENVSGGAGWHFTIDGNDYVTGEDGTVSVIIPENSDDNSVAEVIQEAFPFQSVTCESGTQTVENEVGQPEYTGITVNNHTTVNCTFVNIQPAPEDVLGCTDENALNFNDEATLDDGSCEYPDDVVLGCTNPDATNYNSEATEGNPDAEDCDFPSSGGGGGNHHSGHHGGGSTPAGQVLGASDVCNFAIDTYMRKAYPKNNPAQVKVLQGDILNGLMNAGLVVDGVYGPKTEAAVRAFQIKYRADILDPWHITNPTGIFYKTTLAKAKNLICPAAITPIPTDLINWSQNPEVAH